MLSVEPAPTPYTLPAQFPVPRSLFPLSLALSLTCQINAIAQLTQFLCHARIAFS